MTGVGWSDAWTAQLVGILGDDIEGGVFVVDKKDFVMALDRSFTRVFRGGGRKLERREARRAFWRSRISC